MRNNQNRALIVLNVALALGSICTLPQQLFAAEEVTESDQPVSDTWITTKVKAELLTTKGVKSTDISVTTLNGVVTLSGVVDTKTQVQKSIAVAKAVKGVVSVDSSALKHKD